VYLAIKLFIDDFPPLKAKSVIQDYLEENISLKSLRLFFRKLRRSIRNQIFTEMRNLKLPGPCEIDETPIYREKPGYPFAREYKIQYWFIGIRCRTTKQFVVYPVLWRNHETLMMIILRHVPLGATIYSDCWSAYINNRTKQSHLMKYGYVHYVVNHTYQFVSNFSNTIHINTIERTWRTIKSYIRMLRPKIFIDDYLAKIYLNETQDKEELLSKILKIMLKAKNLGL
jgi:hypothetical protein